MKSKNKSTGKKKTTEAPERGGIIRLTGLTRLEILSLRKQIPDANIEFEAPPTANAGHGELTTVALVAVTLAGMKLITAWLLKDRNRSKITKEIEIVFPDGTRRIEKLNVDISDSKAPEADVLKSLAEIAKVDPSILK